MWSLATVLVSSCIDCPSMMFYFTVTAIITQLFHCVSCQSQYMSVHSAAGTIIGLVKTSTFNSTTYRLNTFLGVPYAESPVGIKPSLFKNQSNKLDLHLRFLLTNINRHVHKTHSFSREHRSFRRTAYP